MIFPAFTAGEKERRAMVWKIVLIIGGSIFLLILIGFIYLMIISKKDGPEAAGVDPRKYDPKYKNPRKKDPRDDPRQSAPPINDPGTAAGYNRVDGYVDDPFKVPGGASDYDDPFERLSRGNPDRSTKGKR